MLQMMFHEATACHVTAELIDLLNIFAELIKSVRVQQRTSKSTSGSGENEACSSSMSLQPSGSSGSGGSGSASEAAGSTSKGTDWRHILARWKDMGDMGTKLLTLCNSFVPPELRDVCLMCGKEMLMLWPNEMLTILVSRILSHSEREARITVNSSLGP